MGIEKCSIFAALNILMHNMMETVVVQINNSKAYKILADLEDLHILKVIKKSNKKTLSLSEKYAGKLTSKTVDALQDYVKLSREEWDGKTI